MGMFCLAVSSGMLIWGRTLLVPYLRSWFFVLYWCICLLFAGAAVGIGAMDFLFTRRRYHQHHDDLIRRTLDRIREVENARTRSRSASAPHSTKRTH
jgi:hypothetical protein